MRNLTLVVALAVVGCNNSERWGDAPEWDTDTDAVTDTDTDTDDDTDTDTDDDTDTDTDDDTDTDSDSDITGDPSACHAYDPVDQVGLTRNYTVEYNGAAGTETQKVEGEELTTNGELAWAVSQTVQTEGEGWSGRTFHTCDERNNLFMVGWNMTLTVAFQGFPLEVGPVEGVHNPPRKYLPSIQDMGGAGSWDGSYDIEVVQEGQTSTIVTEGTYTEFGFSETTVPAGTFDVYIVTSQYPQDRSGVGGFSLPDEFKDFFPDMDVFGALGSFGEDVDAIAEYHYAEDVGLVLEVTGDVKTGDVFMYKELTSYTPGR